MRYKTINDLDLTNQRLLIRLDLNVPIEAGRITSDIRITSALPTIRLALANGSKVLLCSHLGRPTEGQADVSLTLQPVADYLSKALNQPVPLNKNYLQVPPNLQSGQIELLENVRFNVGEKANDDLLAKKYAQLCDIFVMDAFGTAHRAEASTVGVGVFAPQAVAGLLLDAELKALYTALDAPKRPMVAIVGGSKVSTKLALLENLASKVDTLIVGGGIANTFIKAAGYPVGKSLHEADLVATAKRIIDYMQACNKKLPLPTDVVCASEFSDNALATTKQINNVASEDLILDLGVASSKHIATLIKNAGTIVWNGPVGVFEIEQFSEATKIMSTAIATSTAFSIAGGGDTLAAIQKFKIKNQISYISTGGGAFLEFLEGKELVAVAMLNNKR